MGRASRQGTLAPRLRVSPARLHDRRQQFNIMARELDPHHTRDRDDTWQDALPWQKLTEEAQIDCLKALLEKAFEQGEQKHVQIVNIICSRWIAITPRTDPDNITIGLDIPGRGQFLRSFPKGGFRKGAEALLEEMNSSGFFLRESEFPEEVISEEPKEIPPQGEEERLRELREAGFSDEEARAQLESEHWTERHPDREHWTPHQRVIAGGMSQEAYEAVYGRGPVPRPDPEEAPVEKYIKPEGFEDVLSAMVFAAKCPDGNPPYIGKAGSRETCKEIAKQLEDHPVGKQLAVFYERWLKDTDPKKIEEARRIVGSERLARMWAYEFSGVESFESDFSPDLALLLREHMPRGGPLMVAGGVDGQGDFDATRADWQIVKEA